VIISEILSLHNTSIDLLLYKKPFDESFSGWHFSLSKLWEKPMSAGTQWIYCQKA
jgi:hypothetical protein